MAQFDDATAQLVAEKVEEIYGTLLRVRPILREARASDPGIGTGRPNRDAEEALNDRDDTHFNSFDDIVVIGFWWSKERLRFVCSGRGLNFINAEPLMDRAIEIGNKPHAKAKAAYQEFLKVSRNMIQIVPDDEMRRLGRMIRVCYRDCPGAQAFGVTEAEARFFAFLMQNKQVSGEVHLYSTHSPCAGCGQTFERLAIIKSTYNNIVNNPTAHSSPQFTEFRDDYEASSLNRWKIGGLYYGRFYDRGRRTELCQLERAVQNHSIGYYKQLLQKKRG